MYLGNTAGSISSSAGTNSKIIGEAITSTKIQIKELLSLNILKFQSYAVSALPTTFSVAH